MLSRITYFVNQYPKVSHSFIRREIAAMERQGFQIQRIALRGWNAEVVDNADKLELTKTRYVLQDGMIVLLYAMLMVIISSPMRFVSALWLTIKMGFRSERPLPYHLICLAEACVILPWMRDFGSEHAHAHFGTNSTEVVMLAKCLGGPPYSFTVHGSGELDNPAYQGLGEKIRRSAFVVAISSFGRSQLYRLVQHEHWQRVVVIHCGLEPAFYSGIPVRPSAAPRLVCVGRLCEEKGQLLLMEAAHRLAKMGIEFELVLAGDGEMRDDIEILVKKYDLTTKVRITGWISGEQVRQEILESRALVLPSFAEGLPVVIMEAMSLRRPVLTTYVAGIPELVRSGESGWLFPAGCIDELTSAMRACLLAPIDELVRMGEEAYTRVLVRHSVDTEAAKLATLIRSSCEANVAVKSHGFF